MLIYAAIGTFGLLFLLVMLFVGDLFGGDHDIHGGDLGGDHGDVGHEGGPGIFSARIMASFLTAFGVGGIVARYYGLSHPAAAGCGVVTGAVISAGPPSPVRSCMPTARTSSTTRSSGRKMAARTSSGAASAYALRPSRR